MKKTKARRFGLGIIQHMLAAVIMLIIAAIVFNSTISVASMNGTKTYRLRSYGKEDTFESSTLFREIFESAVADITRLVVIKGQLETDGEFDPSKNIDITEYANRKGTGNDCPITVVYQLDDLIKWGKSGVEYTNRPWSMDDFVNYYGAVNHPDNFALDEYGQIYFRGYAYGQDGGVIRPELIWDEATKTTIIEKLAEYTDEQLNDMAFSYIVSQVPRGIALNREEDGMLMVYLSALICRYETVDGVRQLLSCADNWVDYMKLQSNVADTIAGLTESYQLYQNCNELYEEDNSNLKYAVRMMTEEGVRTFTNVDELVAVEESAITEHFGEYRSYFIYYPDSLDFTGNTSLREADIYNYMREYEYAYPETTHIWIGVDTTYPIEGDAFYNANEIFQSILSNVEIIVATLAILLLAWLAILIYQIATTGIIFDENGRWIRRLYRIDHIWTELEAAFLVGFIYMAARLLMHLLKVADFTHMNDVEVQGIIRTTQLYKYSIFVFYGVGVSLLANLFLCSFFRRVKYPNLWKGSFIYWLMNRARNGIHFVLSHSNTAISTLIPYNFFLMVNLFGFLMAYMLRGNIIIMPLLVGALVVFDGVIGVLLFKNGAERLDIIEGIRKIRDGEVDYKLETDSLHGTNKEMADAVNNIGEGIRKAVRTSMKDEQMKSDLITNVSHDIKTPLTSIISYVDLLKRLKIEEEPAKSYIAVLDSKSQRLKQLTDDLVEASKISSGNIELKKEQLDLAELLNQSIGEFSEKLEEKQLDVVFGGSDTAAYIYADSRRMWRVIENLFNNIYKYALSGTRVYINLSTMRDKVELSIKNISERQMNIHGDELTERFIRGDESRTTEGSGLGLSIAKSLIEVQGGTFTICLDGDLFKVVIVFPEYVQETE